MSRWMISSRVSVSGGRPTRRADRDGPRSIGRCCWSSMDIAFFRMAGGRAGPAAAGRVGGTRAEGVAARADSPPEEAGIDGFRESEGGLASLTDCSRYEYQSRRSLIVSPQVRRLLRRKVSVDGYKVVQNGRKLPQGASRSTSRFLLWGYDAMPPTQVRGHGGHLGEDLVSMRQHMSFGSLCLRPHLRGQQDKILLVQDLDVASVGAEQQVKRQILPLYGAGAEANLVGQVYVESQRPAICPHPMVDVVGPPLPEIAIRQGTPRQPEAAYTPCFLDLVEDDGVRGRSIEEPADELQALASSTNFDFFNDSSRTHPVDGRSF